jgi:hypothetical protein
MPLPRIWRAVVYLSETQPGKPGASSGEPSIEQQRVLCRCAATVLHVELVREIVDRWPHSPERPGIEKVKELTLDGDSRIDYLIVSSLDRLASNLDEAFHLAWFLGFAGTVMFPADAAHEFPWTGRSPGH